MLFNNLAHPKRLTATCSAPKSPRGGPARGSTVSPVRAVLETGSASTLLGASCNEADMALWSLVFRGLGGGGGGGGGALSILGKGMVLCPRWF